MPSVTAAIRRTMIARTMKLRSLLVLAALSLVAITGCSKPQEQPSPAPVATSVAKEATLAPTELLPGTIAPFQNVAITSSLAEPTRTVNVNEGDVVRRGQVLAVLNTDDLQADYRQYMASAQGSGATTTQDIYTATQTITTSAQSLLSARAMLRQAQQTLANDSYNLKIDNSLLQNGYVSQQSVTAQRTLVANDQQAVRSDQASLTSAIAARTAAGTMNKGVPASMIQAQQATQQEAYAQAAQYRAQIVRGTIVSPIDGIVVNRYLNPGEYPGTRQLFTIQQLDPVYAVFDASDAQLVGVQKGATVTFTTTDAPNHTYKARVIAILGQVEPGSTSFVVKAVVPNPKYALTSGMTIAGTVALARVRGISIPVTAFLDDSHSSVMTVSSDGTVHTTPVRQIGAATQTAAVVTGLAAGTSIIANGQLGLTDGQKVAVH